MITSDERINICNFYKHIKLKDLLNFRKNSFLRDYFLYRNKEIPPKVYFYYIEECPILKYYYKLYIEILLLNFAFHLSFYFPNKDPQILFEISGLII